MLDFSKAFDLINHHLLIEKLKVNGSPPHVLKTSLCDTLFLMNSI